MNLNGRNNSHKNIFKILSLVIILMLALLGWHAYNIFNSAPWGSPEKYLLEIKQGATFQNIAKELSDKKVIQNNFVFLKQASAYDFPAIGKYDLKLPANSQSVLDQINNRSKVIIEEGKIVTFKILIKEGDTIDNIISSFVKAGVSNQVELEAYFKDTANFTQEVYPYLPKKLSCTYGDILTCAKYPVEGYIYPATYELEKKQTLADHINKILNISQKKFSTLPRQPTDEEVIMASAIEKESGYGSRVRSDANVKQILKQERETIASVLQNRNELKMKWQLNPTTTYGTTNRLCESTFKIDNCKKIDDVTITSNIYNTYINAKPIGPISNPSFESLLAALNPAKTDFIFFIADKNGATRFATTFEQFSKIEQDIINER
jgi:UPF0755 protein